MYKMQSFIYGRPNGHKLWCQARVLNATLS